MMQNQAQWLETLENGYRVRVKFLPLAPAEEARVRQLLANFDVKVGTVVGALGAGPVSVDLAFVEHQDVPVVEPTADELAAKLEALGWDCRAPKPPDSTPVKRARVQ
jgi:hypothetical protein